MKLTKSAPARLLIFTAALFIFQNPVVYAQNKETQSFRVTGVVLNSRNLQPVPGSEFMVNKKDKAITNRNGVFEVEVRKGDSISFTGQGENNARMVIPDSLDKAQYIMGIYLSEDGLKVEDMVFFEGLSSHQLKNDFLNLQQDKNAVYAQSNIGIMKAQSGRSEISSSYAPGVEMALRRFETSIVYKGMISPDNSVMLPILALPGLVYDLATYKVQKEEIEQKIVDAVREYRRRQVGVR